MAFLDLLFYTIILVFTTYKHSPPTGRKAFQSLFVTCKENICTWKGPLVFLLSPLLHTSGLETLSVCLGLYVFGPPALTILGEKRFFVFFLSWSGVQLLGSFIWFKRLNGSLGWVTALALFLYLVSPDSRMNMNYLLVGLQCGLMDPLGTLLGLGLGKAFSTSFH